MRGRPAASLADQVEPSPVSLQGTMPRRVPVPLLAPNIVTSFRFAVVLLINCTVRLRRIPDSSINKIGLVSL